MDKLLKQKIGLNFLMNRRKGNKKEEAGLPVYCPQPSRTSDLDNTDRRALSSSHGATENISICFSSPLLSSCTWCSWPAEAPISSHSTAKANAWALLRWLFFHVTLPPLISDSNHRPRGAEPVRNLKTRENPSPRGRSACVSGPGAAPPRAHRLELSDCI